MQAREQIPSLGQVRWRPHLQNGLLWAPFSRLPGIGASLPTEKLKKSKKLPRGGPNRCWGNKRAGGGPRSPGTAHGGGHTWLRVGTELLCPRPSGPQCPWLVLSVGGQRQLLLGENPLGTCSETPGLTFTPRERCAEIAPLGPPGPSPRLQKTAPHCHPLPPPAAGSQPEVKFPYTLPQWPNLGPQRALPWVLPPRLAP